MIAIRLKSTVFDPGGPFEGVSPSRAVLMIGTGKREQYAAVRNGPPLDNLANINSHFSIPVTLSGAEVDNLIFEQYVKNEMLRTAYGNQIIDFVSRGIIDVLQDGVTSLTPAQISAYTAP